MTTPDQVALGAVTEVQDNAGNLALTWELRPATVSAVQGNFITAVMDGDTNVTPVLSLVGTVSPGDRVHVVQIPPSGNYIVGFAAGAGLVSSESNRWSASTQSVAAAVYQDITSGGLPIEIEFLKQRTSSRIEYYMSMGGFVDNAGTSIAGALQIDGTDYATAFLLFNAANQHQSFSASGHIGVDNLAAGQYTVTARWQRTAGTTARMDANDLITILLKEASPSLV